MAQTTIQISGFKCILSVCELSCLLSLTHTHTHLSHICLSTKQRQTREFNVCVYETQQQQHHFIQWITWNKDNFGMRGVDGRGGGVPQTKGEKERKREHTCDSQAVSGVSMYLCVLCRIKIE